MNSSAQHYVTQERKKKHTKKGTLYIAAHVWALDNTDTATVRLVRSRTVQPVVSRYTD